MQIRDCNDDNPKEIFVSCEIGKNKFVASICDECFSQVDDDLDIQQISKESFESAIRQVQGVQ